MFMNIIIEDTDSSNFLTSDGNWSKNMADGKVFSGTKTAYETAKSQPIGKFSISGYIAENNQIINLRSGHGKGN